MWAGWSGVERPATTPHNTTNGTDRRQVTVPLHEELRTGTLRDIAESAGADDFDAFWKWIDRNA